MMLSYIRQTMPEMTTSKTPAVQSGGKTRYGAMRYLNTLFDEWRVMNPIGNKRAPKHTERFICAKAGSPTRRESQGDGTPIVPGKKHKGVPNLGRGSP